MSPTSTLLGVHTAFHQLATSLVCQPASDRRPAEWQQRQLCWPLTYLHPLLPTQLLPEEGQQLRSRRRRLLPAAGAGPRHYAQFQQPRLLPRQPGPLCRGSGRLHRGAQGKGCKRGVTAAWLVGVLGPLDPCQRGNVCSGLRCRPQVQATRLTSILPPVQQPAAQ